MAITSRRFCWGLLLTVQVLSAMPAMAQTDATVEEIAGSPVLVRTGSVEKPATQGMELSFGQDILTQGQARTQIRMANGVRVRVGAGASLKLSPALPLSLSSGQMLTWADQRLSQPVRIETPIAVAAIQGTTVFIDIPESGRWARFFSWEGTVTVSLLNGTQTVTLQSGQAVIVPRGALRIPPVTTLDPQTLKNNFERNQMINGFTSELSTLPKIRTTVGQ